MTDDEIRAIYDEVIFNGGDPTTFAHAIRKAALEEAARVCEIEAEVRYVWAQGPFKTCAAAIRKLGESDE